MIFRLLLFKHPNTLERGDTPVDSAEIVAPTAAIAVGLARGSIDGAPRSALSHPEDKIVLLDEEGTVVASWDCTDA